MESMEKVTEKELGLLELLDLLPIGEEQIRRYLRDGKLKGRKVRKKWKVTETSLLEFKQAYEF